MNFQTTPVVEDHEALTVPGLVHFGLKGPSGSMTPGQLVAQAAQLLVLLE